MKSLLDQHVGSRKCVEARKLFLEKEQALEGDDSLPMITAYESPVKKERCDSDTEMAPARVTTNF